MRTDLIKKYFFRNLRQGGESSSNREFGVAAKSHFSARWDFRTKNFSLKNKCARLVFVVFNEFPINAFGKNVTWNLFTRNDLS